MNVFHQEPRFDCKQFASCGIHSLSKCRKYKGKLKECQGCNLVRRKSKTLNKTGIGRKVCPHCGRELNITMYGLRKVRKNGREYTYRNAWCKLCTAEKYRTIYRKRILKSKSEEQ